MHRSYKYLKNSARFFGLALSACLIACKGPDLSTKPAAQPPIGQDNRTQPGANANAPALETVTDLAAAAAQAQTPQARNSYLIAKAEAGHLTPERINSAPALSGTRLRGAKIAPSGEFVTVLQGRKDNALQQDLWAYDLLTAQGRILVDSEELLARDKTGAPKTLSQEEKNRRERAREYASGIITYSWASDTQLIFPLGGDIYLYDLAARQPRQVTATDEFETDAKVSDDGTKITYVRKNELYIKDLITGLERQLTRGANDTIRNATASFVVQEEFGRDTGYWMNGNNTRIAYTQIDEADIAIENRLEFRANGVKNIVQRYPFAGTDNARIKLGIVSTSGGTTRWVKLGETQDEYLGDVYLTRAVWSPDNRHLFVGILSRDHKTHIFYKIDSQTGKAEEFYTETSPTWLNIGHILRAADDGGLIWAAQRNDKRQLFKIEANGRAAPLTPETLMVKGLLCQTGEIAYISGWQDDPLSTHIFKVNLRAAKPEDEANLNAPLPDAPLPDAPLVEQITTETGQHSAQFNTDCSRFLGSYNSATTPPQLRAYKIGSEQDAAPEPLAWLNENALNDSHPYAPYLQSRITPEFGQIEADDGTQLDYALYKPKNMKPNEKRASVTLVYNGPGVQRVADKWRGTDFPNMLAHHGFIVFMVDGRGASNRGKAFEDVLYRALGKAEIIDQSAGARWLKSQSFIDPDRMGVYGWSYGGYMSLHMLAQTNHYAAGAAGAPVTDWALYDTAYTERYLGSPVKDSENYTAGAYENAAIFPHLDGLTEPLLLIHGMADDNVVFRHSVKLMDAMQKSGAQNLRVMTYPGEKHGFRNRQNRIHKDRQILEFFLETLDITDEK